MITLRRAGERRHDRRGEGEAWLTFYPEGPPGPLIDGFGVLEIFNEDRLPPGADVAGGPHHDAEIITYVREGALVYDDSMGGSGIVQAGEFQCKTPGPGIHPRETNASRTEWAHVFQIWLRPGKVAPEVGQRQRRFSAAERRGGLCIVASPDARRGSLRVHQDTLLYSAMLDPGQHVVHALTRGRRAWLHVVQGEATLGDLVLTTGDGVGITAERAVSLTARAQTEVLLLDLNDPGPAGN